VSGAISFAAPAASESLPVSTPAHPLRSASAIARRRVLIADRQKLREKTGIPTLASASLTASRHTGARSPKAIPSGFIQ
jgi:hypothetical protein